ncbi:type VII secretion protein EccC [Flindersiella endophytica]
MEQGERAELTDLLGIGDPRAIDPAVAWRPRSPRDRLRVPVGLGDSGRPIELDIKPAALDGMGPHGMVVGEGKTGLLRTLLYGFALTHAPDDLNFLLVDSGDGRSFRDLDQLPHTSAVVTDLKPELVDRLCDTLAGELTRRQALLHAAGPYTSRDTYTDARIEGAPLDPMPSLLVVIDGFSELLGSSPDFAALLVQIGRVGRGLGVHLLLAADRLEDGRLRGLDGYLAYRFGLRTNTAAESRAVIGVPDAHEQPDHPGIAYLKAGTDTLERFRAAEVSPEAARTIGERLRGKGTPAYRIWPPPLDEPPNLDTLLPPERTTGGLRIPVAVVDKPFEHRQDALWLDLSGDRGNVAIVGRARSGKTTLLRSLIEALTTTHTPNQVRFALPSAVTELTASLEQRMHHRSPFPPDVFLVIDGWSAGALPTEHEPAVAALAAHGGGCGIHVIATAERWDEFPAAVKKLFQTRLELRLDDPAGSDVHPRLAANVPGDRPGRGLTADKLHFLGALPADPRQ